jgi:EmrB/QacA subfamily drug resistance transporter
MLLLDITIVNVALPAIQHALKASFSNLQWVIDAYALSLATCTLTAGTLADLFGRKRVFILGIVLFTIASAACGASFDPLFLIVARAVQGIGGAMMFATALAILSQEFHGRERGTAFGIWGATIGAAVAIGPLAGGMLTSWISWRWIFLVNIPIGIGAVVLSLAQLHESKDPEHSRLDPVGLVTLSAGVFCLILALIEGNQRGWSSGVIIGLLAAAAVILALFIASQARGGTTMIDLALFGRPGFVGAQVTAFAISSSMFAMFLYLTLYLQDILKLSPVATGVRFLPLSAISFFAAPLAGRLSATLPVRALLGFGLALNAIAMWTMSRVTPTSHWTVLLPGFLLGGVGIGFVNAPLATAAIGTVRVERAGMASGINNTFRQIGLATGIAALGAIFEAKTGGQQHASAAQFVHGLHFIMLVGAGVAAAGAVLAFALVRRRDFVASAARPANA